MSRIEVSITAVISDAGEDTIGKARERVDNAQYELEDIGATVSAVVARSSHPQHQAPQGSPTPYL